jgi:hypothetical protein
MTDFIGVYPDVFNQRFCDDLISTFNWAEEHGLVKTRQEREGGMPLSSKNDVSLYAAEFDVCHAHSKIASGFTEIFWGQVFPRYKADYSEALDGASGGYAIYSLKMQKTKPGQGYHSWHYEAAAREVSNRLLAWAVYLNDVDEGGETEFLYYHRRIKPARGTVVLWPAGFTHTHRGNPPLSGEKYIMTGWIEF